MVKKKKCERLYEVWANIKQRCFNPNNPDFKYYGGRGITMCDEWEESFIAFQDWAMANGYDENAPRGECTLDRIDVNGNYEPNNCRWVSMIEQNQNRRESPAMIERFRKIQIEREARLRRVQIENKKKKPFS